VTGEYGRPSADLIRSSFGSCLQAVLPEPRIVIGPAQNSTLAVTNPLITCFLRRSAQLLQPDCQPSDSFLDPNQLPADRAEDDNSELTISICFVSIAHLHANDDCGQAEAPWRTILREGRGVQCRSAEWGSAECGVRNGRYDKRRAGDARRD